MKGYKAFDENWKCRDKQYEVGKTYEEEEAELCESGIHFCENPLDVLNYYDLCNSKFAEIEAENVSKQKSADTKRVAKKVSIKGELTLKGFIEAAFNFIFEKTDSASGYYSQLAASGDYSQLAASGDSSKLAASGYSSKLAASGYSSQCGVSGKNSIASSIGHGGKAKGALGCWIVLSEFAEDGKIICVKSTLVDGTIIKANTWYALKNEQFIERN
jgi:hypothetical protein